MGLQLLYALSGCLGSQQTKPEVPIPLPPQHTAPSKGYHEHIVRWRNESLSIIAKWYTGNLGNSHLLSEANPNLPDPDLIRQGDIIRIPIDIMQTKEPLPEDFVKTNIPASSPKRFDKSTATRPPRRERPSLPLASQEPEIPPACSCEISSAMHATNSVVSMAHVHETRIALFQKVTT